MTKIKIEDLEVITSTNAKLTFGDIIYQTAVEGKKFLVNRNGKPMVVIIGFNEYQKLTNIKKLSEL